MISRTFFGSQLWAMDDPVDPLTAVYIGELAGRPEAMTWNGERLLYVATDNTGRPYLLSIPYPIETNPDSEGRPVVAYENHGPMAVHQDYQQGHSMSISGMTWDGERLLYTGNGPDDSQARLTRVLWALEDYTKPESAQINGRFPEIVGGAYLAVSWGNALTWDGTQLLLYDDKGGELFSIPDPLRPDEVEFLVRDGPRGGASLAWTGSHIVLGTHEDGLFVLEQVPTASPETPTP